MLMSDGAPMADSAMANKVAKDDREAAADRGQSAIEHEPQQRARPKQTRESPHAWIVHFDAERSSGPLVSNDEEWCNEGQR